MVSTSLGLQWQVSSYPLMDSISLSFPSAFHQTLITIKCYVELREGMGRMGFVGSGPIPNSPYSNLRLQDLNSLRKGGAEVGRLLSRIGFSRNETERKCDWGVTYQNFSNSGHGSVPGKPNYAEF